MRVLVIDDEKNIRAALTVCLEASGCQVTAVATGEAALAAISQLSFDLAFLDMRLGNESGIDLLPRLLAESPNLSVVLITAYATAASAVEAIQRGAKDYLQKPFTPEQIRHVVAKVAERRAAEWRLAELGKELQNAVPEVDLDTHSARMRATLDIVARAAGSEAAVLLRGENGTGKGVLARLLHTQGPRRERPLVVVNCPTLSEELLTSELFGHAKGSFTGAVRDQPGRVESAEGGTLFLDEIAEMAPGLQAKLLRFAQEKQFERVGESRTRRADVRIVAATNRDLEADVAVGRFRRDLLYRLNVVEDIVPMARRFLAFFARAACRSTQDLSPRAEKLLVEYPWPGNVRELRNTMERTVILWPAQVVEPAAFPERMLAETVVGPRLGADATLDEIEREHVLRVVARATSLEEAARILGIDTSTLYRKRRQYGGEESPGLGGRP